MKADGGQYHGSLISTVLAGSWRPAFPLSLRLSQGQLDEVTPLLYGSGAAALGWWRVSGSELRQTASAEVLQQAYRMQVLQSAIHEENIKTVLSLLRAQSIEAILVKGWAAAGMYPERGLRPYGDIDLCVRASDWKAANDVLSSPAADGCWVDLHKGFSELADRTVAQLFERSRLVPLEDIQVRVLSAEDHLALLAIHFLKHGAWRPLWLCDIGAAVESLPADFDWKVCFGPGKRRAGWIRSAIFLAHTLLDARIDDLPFRDAGNELHSWLLETVMKEWAHPFAGSQPPMSHPLPMVAHLRHPSGLLQGLRERWPNPILATISVNGSFNRMPPLPYQLGNCIARACGFLIRLPRSSQRSR